MPPESDDSTDLRERVAELEATVEAQQDTIRRMLPSRRSALKAGGLVAGGGLLGALTADRAAAQASGQVGTTSDPIDVVAYSVQDRSGSNMALENVASGSVTLSSGTATVDTGISATGATFYLALGVDDPNADTNLAGKLFWDDSAGTYKVTIDEVETSVGNPTANYSIVRVR